MFGRCFVGDYLGKLFYRFLGPLWKQTTTHQTRTRTHCKPTGLKLTDDFSLGGMLFWICFLQVSSASDFEVPSCDNRTQSSSKMFGSD